MSKRFDYVKYDGLSQKAQEEIKQKFIELEFYIEALVPGREKALVHTKLEEAYMWVGKAIRNDQIVRNGKADLQEERTDS